MPNPIMIKQGSKENSADLRTNSPNLCKKDQHIKIATWTIKRGLIKRGLEINELLDQEKIDLLFLTETDLIYIHT